MFYRFPDIWVTRARSEAGAHERFVMHTHATAELFCFLSGKAVYHVEGNAYELNSGDILLMRPAEAHYIETDASLPYERIYLNFNTDIFSSLDQEGVLMRPFFEREQGKHNRYRAADFGNCDHLACLDHMVASGDRLIILGNLMLLLQQIEALFRNGIKTTPETVQYQIIRYINDHLKDDLSLQELCDRFYISRAQLCRLFRSSTGTTVGKYIMTKRLISAQQQILTGKRPSEVFFSCGYSDYSSFYRAYQRFFGHSPCVDQGRHGVVDPGTDRMEIS